VSAPWKWRPGHVLRVDVGEEALELRAAPVDPALHRPHREPRDLGDLLVGELLDVAEDDDLPELLGDLLQGLLDVPVLEAALGGLSGEKVSSGISTSYSSSSRFTLWRE
jgi:hypothetical protein